MENKILFLLLFIYFTFKSGRSRHGRLLLIGVFSGHVTPIFEHFIALLLQKLYHDNQVTVIFTTFTTSKKMPNNILKNVCFKSVDLIGKKFTQKSYLQKTFASYQYRRGQTPILHPFFADNFFISKFLAFFSTVLKSATKF